jgi:hypothetical protein
MPVLALRLALGLRFLFSRLARLGNGSMLFLWLWWSLMRL